MSKKLKNLLLTIIAIFIFVFTLDAITSLLDGSSKPLESAIISASEIGYSYNTFAEALSSSGGNFAEVKTSSGSEDNINKLISGEADYALSQGDTIYFSYNGMKGLPEQRNLRIISPIFKESVRLYSPASSDVTRLGDLNRGNICVGALGSGTYYNAVAVLSEIRMESGVDFEPIYLNASECMLEIKNGADIHGLFQTSYAPVQSDGLLREIYLPLSLIDRLEENYPFYMGVNKDVNGRARRFLSVETYIVAKSNLPNSKAKHLASHIRWNWTSIRDYMPVLDEQPPSIKEVIIPVHNGAKKTFSRSPNSQNKFFINPLILFSWLTLLFVCIYAERQKATYNRMGDSTIDAVADKIIISILGKISKPLIAFSVIIFLTASAVLALRLAEQMYSRTSGQPSAFLDMSFPDSLAWLFSYISSGFTTDGVYPISIVGQMIAAILAVFGILGPFSAIIYLINIANHRAKNAVLGYGESHFKNHVVLCGWNEKAPGIIYTLTGQDVDERNKITVIAETEQKNPFETHNFDPHYVNYIKGNSADRRTLERANAHHADSALILADFQGISDQNADSILTAMNFRKVNSSAHICVELEYEENRDLFHACGCDMVIDEHNIISRLAAIAILTPEIIDYVLDTISYHDYDELYSVRPGITDNLKFLIGKTVRDAELSFIQHGINLIGMLQEDYVVNKTTHDEFGELSNLTALVDKEDSLRLISADSVLIYASKDRSRIKYIDSGKKNFSVIPISKRGFRIEYKQSKRIIACGDESALTELRANLCNTNDNIEITEINIETNKLKTFNDVNNHISGRYDTVVILVSRDVRSSFTSEIDMHTVDAQSILLTRLFQKVFEAQEVEPTIISEILAIKNKQLFVDAGADIVLPSSLTVERFLTKEVYDNANVVQYVNALLNRCDDVFLHAHRVTQGDGFCGELYTSALCTEIQGLRIVGWLPHSQRNILRNEQGDFDYHYRTVIDDRNTATVIKPEDIIIMVIKPRGRYYCT